MKVAPHLIPRAALVRLRSLDLGGLSDYYMSSSAESSSALVAAAPETTNMYVLAYGDKEGLAPGERLEAYGSTVRLVRTMAYGCPRGVTPASVAHGALTPAELNEITHQLNCVDALYRELDPAGPPRGATPAAVEGTRGAAATAVEDVWRVVRTAGPRVEKVEGEAETKEGSTAMAETSATGVDADAAAGGTSDLSASELAKQLRRMRRSNMEVVVAEWRRHTAPESFTKPASGEGDEDLLVENGVCYATPEQAGLRVLRSARLAFMSMIERNANSVREAQHRRAMEERRPLAILDVSGIDFSFSHAAVQATAELGLRDESQCTLHFIPLTRRAARRAEGGMAKFVRQIARAPGVPHEDPFTYVSLRHMDAAAYTTFLDLPSYRAGSSSSDKGGGGGAACEGEDGRPPSYSERKEGSPRARTPASRSTREVALSLARTLTTVRTGAPVLATFVPTPRSAAAIYDEVSQGRRAEVAMESRTVAEAKACVAEAIARSGRWGYITDELLPMVDCAQGGAVSLVVTVH